MIIRKIELENPTETILQAISFETDLFVLQQAMAQEGSKGRRASVMGALEKRALSLRSHGEGSEGPDFDIPGRKVTHPDETLFRMHNRSTPADLKEHDFGEGHKAVQKITKVERIHGEMEKADAKRRMNTPSELFRVTERLKNGAILFPWGHVMPYQKEVKDDDGKKVLVKFRPSKVYLKACPACGRINRPEQGMFGKCYNCELDMVPHVKADYAADPEKYEGVRFT